MTHSLKLNLPPTWSTTELRVVADLIRGVSYKKDDAKDYPSGDSVPLLRATNITGSSLTFDGLVHVPARYVSSDQVLRGGDIVIASSSGSKEVVGKAGQLTSAPTTISFGAFCTAIRPAAELDSKYLGFYFQSPAYRSASSDISAGSNINNIKSSELAAHLVPIAPRAEQARIVERLEEVLSDLDAGAAELKAAQRKLAQYRQSLLKAAVEGTFMGYRCRVASDEQLPKGWTRLTLNDVAEWSSGGTPSRANPSFYSGSIPWIKTGELGPKFIIDTEEHINDEAIASSSAKVFPRGSVALAMYGATIGKASILGIDAATNQACAVGIPKASICTEFLYYYLLSQAKEFASAGKGGAQPNISQGIVKSWPLLLPPLEEQRKVVAALEAQLEALGDQQAAVERGLRHAAAQRKNLLKSAFAGLLVAQEPNDEPASELLTRLKTVRAQTTAVRSRRKNT